MTLPCLSPRCPGQMVLTDGWWLCPVCLGAFTNDQVREAHDATAEQVEREPPFSAWRDEQRRTALLGQGHGGRASKSKRFGNKKRGGWTPWWRRA